MNKEGKIVDINKRIPVTYTAGGRKTTLHPNAARHLFYKGIITYDEKKDETDDTHVSDIVLAEAPDAKEKKGGK